MKRPTSTIDDRWTAQIVHDVAETLLAHGYPYIDQDSDDFYSLMWVLYRFLYGVPSVSTTSSPETSSNDPTGTEISASGADRAGTGRGSGVGVVE